MLKILGTMQCKDCVACCEAFDREKIEYTFCDFRDDLAYLKEFLKYRDREPDFEQAKTDGGIGIPCIIREDGTITLDWESYVSQADA